MQSTNPECDQILQENVMLKAQVDQLLQQIQLWVQELKRRNMESDLLNRLAHALQTCRSIADLHNQLGQFIYRLFLEQPGELFLYNENKQVLERSFTWGDIHKDPILLRKEYCQSMDQNKLCLSSENSNDRCLYHQTLTEEGQENSSYVCSPLLHQDQLIGMLHQHLPAISSLLQNTNWVSNEHWGQLATAVSERLATTIVSVKCQQNKTMQELRDPLTNVFNRWYMQETLNRELKYAKRHSAPLWVYYMDIDRMKRVNDRHGFDVGDEFLRRTSFFLQQHIRAEDVVCRSGGDEFTLILLGIPNDIAMIRAQKLREGIKDIQVKTYDLLNVNATCSFGIAGFPNHGENATDLLLAADRALLHAKSEGRDQVQIAS